jgi:hypothetical protein
MGCSPHALHRRQRQQRDPRRAPALTLALAALAAGACGSDAHETTQLFRADYASSFVQVRPCRTSPDHDLNNVRVLADPLAAGPYQMRDRPFPTGAIVLKEEHDLDDATCTGKIVAFTVMVKLADGSDPEQLDWHWQKVDATRTVQTDNEPRCYSCHTTCGVPPDGYLGNCSVP